MSISQALENQFSPEVRARGWHYYVSRKVRLQVTRPALVMAEVEGSEVYRVYLSPDGHDECGAFCSCPAFDRFESCKHIWATLLEADSHELPWLEPDRKGLLVPMELEDFLENKEAAAAQERMNSWRLQLSRLRTMMHETPPGPRPSEGSEVLYVLDVDRAVEAGTPVVHLYRRRRKTDGEWGALKVFRATAAEIAALPDASDREVIGALQGARPGADDNRFYFEVASEAAESYRLEQANAGLLLPLLCRTERFFLRRAGNLAPRPLTWDPGPPWVLGLKVSTVRREGRKSCEVRGFLERGGERMDLGEPDLLLLYGQVFAHGRVAALDARGAFAWVNLLREGSELRARPEEQEELVEGILGLPSLPLLDLPAPWASAETPALRPHLVAEPDGRNGSSRRRIACKLRFDYGGVEVGMLEGRQTLRRDGSYELFPRDFEGERQALARLFSLGARPASAEERSHAAFVAAGRFPEVVRELLAAGWKVEAEGKLYRRPGAFRMVVSSGVDWLDLGGEIDFEGVPVPLPELLEAAESGTGTIRLGDGSVGLLPEEWLKRCGLLASLAETDGDGLRLRRSQALLLDSLLASIEPEVDLDSRFAQLRRSLHEHEEALEPRDEPETFQGSLRAYQRQTLGWFSYLQRLGFGGCLADDMGLGKTVQVLALLEERRASGTERGPSLVVVPRSLVFNWLREAARFAPKLATLDYTGVRRKELAAKIPESHMVVTTYGVLRRDILKLREIEFDYAVLDEAQAVKNAHSQSAKSVRLLNARHRLALSGTPIENHLGELWSLFEFLNPGMLGQSTAFRDLASERQGGDEERDLLARAVRPFILRRTKEQVIEDLPKKVEQTLVCDMKPRQRKLYDELRDHYRASLSKRIASAGMAKTRMHVLEALLRLRQAACHPGLIDRARKDCASAKLEVLLPKLVEVCEQGHKALVFSQFTSLLALVRERLEENGLEFEYLDGKTRDRERRVERFQNGGPPVFLISLKAGGLGLNLTAADYVFILDPWWNPAVEAQAIDRAHRIGQTRRVFAYRLICRDTVEEKILELQQQKRDLADAIIRSDGGVLKGLDQDDLDVLLS